MTPFDFLQARMALAARFRFRETSGYRSPAANQAAGGVTHSAHQHFLAADVILDTTEDRVAFKLAAGRLGLLVLTEEDHEHLQPLDWTPG
jgi:uncharacterized protein YcbK (DUF882 family)